MYSIAVKLRNIAYDKGIINIKKLPVPVISVGNISLGGSGKTPTVKFIAEKILEDKRVCIILRGYKRKGKGTFIVSEYGQLKADVHEAGDEAFMLAKLLPKVSVVVSENRYEGGMLATNRLKPDIIILDDGFQHRKLHRDVDLVLIRKRDLKDRLLPFGRLREPLSSLKRADGIILSYQEYEPFDICTNKPKFKMYRIFNHLITYNLERIPINEDILGREIICISALGDNKQFLHTLKSIGFKIKKHIHFIDHHDYRNIYIDKKELYITSLKDIFKIGEYENVLALDMEVKIEGLREFIVNKLS